MTKIKKCCELFFFLIVLSGYQSCSYFSQNNGQVHENVFAAGQKSFPPLSDEMVEKMSKNDLVLYLRGQAQTVKNNPAPVLDLRKSLSFSVNNNTGREIFVTCFYWMKSNPEGMWHWEKSKVHKLLLGETQLIVLNEIEDSRDRRSVCGYLGVFDSFSEADAAVYERTDERKLLDLDRIILLKNKVIPIEIKKYGITGGYLTYEVTGKNVKPQNKQIDLLVENQTGKEVLVCCFVYDQPERTFEFDVWRYDKTPLQKFGIGEIKYINIPSVADPYRYSYIRGTLGIFDMKEQKIAEDTTLELAPAENKLSLGLLAPLHNKKILLKIEKYGMFGDFIDYTVKPAAFFNRKTGEWLRITRKTNLKAATASAG